MDSVADDLQHCLHDDPIFVPRCWLTVDGYLVHYRILDRARHGSCMYIARL